MMNGQKKNQSLTSSVKRFGVESSGSG